MITSSPFSAPTIAWFISLHEFGHAADAVIGKAGCSTLAEVYMFGVPLGYVRRASFQKSAILEDFVSRHMPRPEISADALASGLDAGILQQLLALPHTQRSGTSTAPPPLSADC